MLRYPAAKLSRSSMLLALAVLAIPATDAPAQVKAFRISGAGIAPLGLPDPTQGERPHWILGNATHLGRHTGQGTVKTASLDFSTLPQGFLTGTFSSGQPFVFVGANGDRLACDYGRDANGQPVGTFRLNILGAAGASFIVEAIFDADFVPRPAESTGKFSGVTGSWRMIARTAPFILGSSDPLPYQWAGQGRLNFRQGGRFER